MSVNEFAEAPLLDRVDDCKVIYFEDGKVVDRQRRVYY